MDIQEDRFVSAVEAIYGAAASPSLWPAALHAIAQVSDDVGTVLLWRRDDGSYGTIVSPALTAAKEDYERRWWRDDIRSVRGVEKGYLSSGNNAITDRDVVTAEEIETHPIYTHFLVPHGLGWFAAARISPDPLVDVWISVQRNRTRSPYSSLELQTVSRLAIHAEKAFRLSIQLLDAELTKVGLGVALARLGIGVFALDSLGRVVFSNPAAQRLSRSGVEVRDGQLLIAASTEQRAFQRAVARSVRGSAADLSTPAEPILVRRVTANRPLVLYVLPIPASGTAAQQFLTNVRAIVLVIDPEPDGPADPAVVRDMLGLTLGEARVAALVGSGLRPRDAAAKLGIAEDTARTVLKTVFSKVGVSRQTELAALLTKMVLR